MKVLLRSTDRTHVIRRLRVLLANTKVWRRAQKRSTSTSLALVTLNRLHPTCYHRSLSFNRRQQDVKGERHLVVGLSISSRYRQPSSSFEVKKKRLNSRTWRQCSRWATSSKVPLLLRDRDSPTEDTSYRDSCRMTSYLLWLTIRTLTRAVVFNARSLWSKCKTTHRGLRHHDSHSLPGDWSLQSIDLKNLIIKLNLLIVTVRLLTLFPIALLASTYYWP